MKNYVFEIIVVILSRQMALTVRGLAMATSALGLTTVSLTAVEVMAVNESRLVWIMAVASTMRAVQNLSAVGLPVRVQIHVTQVRSHDICCSMGVVALSTCPKFV